MAWDPTAICSNNPQYGGRGNPKQGDEFEAAPNIDHTQVGASMCMCVLVRLARVPILPHTNDLVVPHM